MTRLDAAVLAHRSAPSAATLAELHAAARAHAEAFHAALAAEYVRRVQS